jgi:hypothetical protein
MFLSKLILHVYLSSKTNLKIISIVTIQLIKFRFRKQLGFHTAGDHVYKSQIPWGLFKAHFHLTIIPSKCVILECMCVWMCVCPKPVLKWMSNSYLDIVPISTLYQFAPAAMTMCQKLCALNDRNLLFYNSEAYSLWAERKTVPAFCLVSGGLLSIWHYLARGALPFYTSSSHGTLLSYLPI